MYILKDFKCSRCGNDIQVLFFYDKDINKNVVDCGRCVHCDKGEILPCEDFGEFVREHCISKHIR